jgi:hypothetical protein
VRDFAPAGVEIINPRGNPPASERTGVTAGARPGLPRLSDQAKDDTDRPKAVAPPGSLTDS